MTFLLGLLAVIAGVACLILCVVILLQEPKGGGLAAALGGSGMEAIGVNTGQVNRFTSWTAAIWIAALLLHALLMPLDNSIAGSGEPSADDTVEVGDDAPGEGGGTAPGSGDE